MFVFNSAGTYRELSLRRNGTGGLDLDSKPPNSVTGVNLFVSIPVRLADGDYLEAVVVQNSAITLDIAFSAFGQGSMSLFRIGD